MSLTERPFAPTLIAAARKGSRAVNRMAKLSAPKYQPRMRTPQLVEREAELGGRAGLEVLHEHVG